MRLVHRDVGLAAEKLVERLHMNPGNRYLLLALSRVSNLTPGQLREIGLAAFFYAGLFIIEGIGLWRLKRWGEWVTVVVTSSLMPFECIALWRHPDIAKLAVFVANAAIVAYLIYVIGRTETLDQSSGGEGPVI